MKLSKTCFLFGSTFLLLNTAYAHYPYVAPLSYQTFNHHSAIISGFYDNPFASEVAIKNFKFHFHTPVGEKIEIAHESWSNTQTLSSYTLANKTDGTYRIRGVKQGTRSSFALDGKVWKSLIGGQPSFNKAIPEHVVYTSQLSKKAKIKTVQTTELIETFISRKSTSNKVIEHIHDGFDIQFLTHPNTIQVNQPIHFKILDDRKGITQLKVEILNQTHDFSRTEKVYKSLKTDAAGDLKFSIAEKGQYLLKLDYQQPFTQQNDDLKRYKYTLSFNVI